jgi:hypothetical protein
MGKFVRPDPGIQTRAHEEAKRLKGLLAKGKSVTGKHPGHDQLFGHTTKN